MVACTPPIRGEIPAATVAAMKLAGADEIYILGGVQAVTAMAVGTLMNARGLMELVVLKIGLDAGLIGPELFTLMFGMTLVTTVMTSPLLSLWARRGEGAALADRARPR